MLPSQLRNNDFASYPPLARKVAVANLELLRKLPLPLLPILLTELIDYDWKLPAERRQIDAQLHCLGDLPPQQLALWMQGFCSLRLSDTMLRANWFGNPKVFVEQLTAWLWSTQQMDAFRSIADAYTSSVARMAPAPSPALPRLGIVVLGHDVEQSQYPLFRKLKPGGVHFTRVQPKDGVDAILDYASRRARKQSAQQSALQSGTFAHWYIDGGAALPSPSLTQISYQSLTPVRRQLLALTQRTIASGTAGPEALRAQYAQLKPQDIGFPAPRSSGEEILNHFQLSLFTNGSGTQIFATTFVQWAARECLRRAQPETLVLRYAPRQQARTMDQMLTDAQSVDVDPMGSLVDADMGAYYTWLNLQRLSGADDARFLVWFENNSQALAIGPGLARGSTSNSTLTVPELLHLLD